MTALSETLVLAKAKAQSLDQVRNLNLWGCSLADIKVLAGVKNVAVLSLSVNQIADLGPLTHLDSLTELYLRNNHVSSLQQLAHLQQLANLRVLWLSDNPLERTLREQGRAQAARDTPGGPHSPGRQFYRRTIVSLLPGLEKLDDEPVGDADRAPPSPAAAYFRAAARAEPRSILRPASLASSPVAGHSRRTSGDPATPERKPIWLDSDEQRVKTDILSLAGLERTGPAAAAQGAPKRLSLTERPAGSASNIVAAIAILLNNLDSEGLLAVAQHCERRLQQL